MAAERTCDATTADGEPCGAPATFVDPESGLCPAHDPRTAEKVKEAARKGGAAAARKRRSPGIETEGKYELRSYEDVQQWTEIVVRAVLAGKITHQQARAALNGLETWMEAYEEGQVTERLDELEAALERWRETGDASHMLEVVEGGRP